MSRYIDADALKEMIHYTDDFYETPYVEWEDIVLAPTVDAVQVVRCKDCRWFDREEPDNLYGYCHAAKHGYMSSRWEISIYRKCKEDFFCADGERRTDEQQT